MAKNQSHQRPPRTASRKVVAAAPSLPQGNISYRTFDPHNLATSVIALPLLQMLERDRGDREKVFPIIIDLHLDSPDGLPAAKNRVIEATKKIIKDVGINKHPKHQGIDEVKSQWTPQYLFARLEGQVIRELVRRDGKPKAGLQDRKKGRRDYIEGNLSYLAGFPDPSPHLQVHQHSQSGCRSLLFLCVRARHRLGGRGHGDRRQTSPFQALPKPRAQASAQPSRSYGIGTTHRG
jgi:hypothetical protein